MTQTGVNPYYVVLHRNSVFLDRGLVAGKRWPQRVKEALAMNPLAKVECRWEDTHKFDKNGRFWADCYLLVNNREAEGKDHFLVTVPVCKVKLYMMPADAFFTYNNKEEQFVLYKEKEEYKALCINDCYKSVSEAIDQINYEVQKRLLYCCGITDCTFEKFTGQDELDQKILSRWVENNRLNIS